MLDGVKVRAVCTQVELLHTKMGKVFVYRAGFIETGRTANKKIPPKNTGGCSRDFSAVEERMLLNQEKQSQTISGWNGVSKEKALDKPLGWGDGL